MINSAFTRKFFSSPIVLFFYYTCFFGCLMPIFMGSPSLSWKTIIMMGAPYGLAMTLFTKWKLKKHDEALGLNSSDRRRALREAVKTGRAPSDPDARGTLIAYSNKYFKTVEGNRKYFLAAIMATAFANFLLGLGSHNKIRTIGAVIFLFLATAIYFVIENKTTKLVKLYRQLDTTSPTPIVSVHRKDVLKGIARTFFRFSVRYFGLLSILVGFVFSLLRPAVTLKFGLPLIIVGLILAIPYYWLQKRRWTITYLVALFSAVIWAIYSLYTPLGPNKIAAANVGRLAEMDSSWACAIWFVFHSSIVLASFCILITLDATTKSKKQLGHKKEWAIATAFIIGSIFVVTPLGGTPRKVTQQPETTSSSAGSLSAPVPSGSTIYLSPSNLVGNGSNAVPISTDGAINNPVIEVTQNDNASLGNTMVVPAVEPYIVPGN